MTGEENKQVYERYIQLLNAQDYRALDEVVDPERYREICVGFRPGWVDLPEAVAALEKVVGGIPDLNARIDDLVCEDDKVYARLTVTGTNTGRFFGVPPTGRAYEVSNFGYARLEDGRMVEASSSLIPSPSSNRCMRGPPGRGRGRGPARSSDHLRLRKAEKAYPEGVTARRKTWSVVFDPRRRGSPPPRLPALPSGRLPIGDARQVLNGSRSVWPCSDT